MGVFTWLLNFSLSRRKTEKNHGKKEYALMVFFFLREAKQSKEYGMGFRL